MSSAPVKKILLFKEIYYPADSINGERYQVLPISVRLGKV